MASEIEERFRIAVGLAKAQIDIERKTAEEALDRAKVVSETYGVPFKIPGFDSEVYVPESFSQFSELQYVSGDDILYELLHISESQIGRDHGWNSSGCSF